jgi:hypothetical protein
LQATAVAGTTVLTLPAATDTLVGKATTDTLTNKTLTGAVMNGTVGATTPSTGAFTTLTTTGTINLLTVSRGASSVSGNSALGTSALDANTGGYQSTALGHETLNAQTSGGDNTAAGFRALKANVTGNQNSAFGSSALIVNTGGRNTAIGAYSLNKNMTATDNTAVGESSLNNNLTGTNCSAFGSSTLFSNTTGGSNCAFGTVAAGLSALYYNTTGSQNSAFGNGALGNNTTSDGSVAIGHQALHTFNRTADAEAKNVAIGHKAGFSATTGQYNFFAGHLAGEGSTPLTTGSNNIYIGVAAVPSAATVSNELVIGVSSTGKGASTGFINPNSGGVYQGNNSTLWSITSDQRLKKNIVDNNIGLGIINQIQVRNFEYRLPEEVTDVPQEQAIPKQGIQLGVIAQELQQILPECVKTESTGVMTVDADNLTWYLVNAVKELSAQVAQLQYQLKGN